MVFRGLGGSGLVSRETARTSAGHTTIMIPDVAEGIGRRTGDSAPARPPDRLTQITTHSVTASKSASDYLFPYSAAACDGLATAAPSHRDNRPFRIPGRYLILASSSPILSPMLPVNHYI